MINPITSLVNAYQSLSSTVGGWFSPSVPMAPVAPPGTEPRQYEFMVGQNLLTTTKNNEGINFWMLRNLADSCDLLRLAIETRKDAIAPLKWDISPRKRRGMTGKDLRDAAVKQKATIDKAYNLLSFPNGVDSWEEWMRPILEDSDVIDAATIEVRRNVGGDVCSLDYIDGATIVPKIDITGRTPKFPDTAYQQVLYGMPAVDLTTQDIIYAPRNRRTNKIYGYSPVEQLVATVNIAIRRQLYILGFFTEGNIPETAFCCPEGWNTQQITQFQAYWDSMFEGNQNVKRKGRFIPSGVKPVVLKSPELKQEIDEWLARIIMYAFSLPPTPFVKETNRATAETVADAAKAEGLAPRKVFIKSLMNKILWLHCGWTEIEFDWVDEEAAEPLEKAQIDQIYLAAKVLTPDEVREDLGKDPLTPEQQELLNPPPPPQLMPGEVDENGKPVLPGETKPAAPLDTAKPTNTSKIEKVKKKNIKPLSRETPELKKAEKKLAKIMRDFFTSQGSVMAKQLFPKVKQLQEVEKAELTAEQKRKKLQAQIDQALLEVNFNGWTVLYDDVEPVLEDIAQYSSARALLQVEVDDQDITNLANEKSIAWAQDRAASMVGMKMVDGELVDNPNAKWAITESTRDYLRSSVTQAVEEGWSTKQLATEITGGAAFDNSRADMVARTEMINADVQGRLIGYQESGVVEGKQSIMSDLHDDDDECDDNADAGVIALDDAFPSGDDAPPYHPRCECDIIPVVNMPDENDEDGDG